MASSAGSRSLARARADVTSIYGSNLSPDAGFSRSVRRNWQQRCGPHPASTLETAKRKIVPALTSADASLCRAFALP